MTPLSSLSLAGNRALLQMSTNTCTSIYNNNASNDFVFEYLGTRHLLCAFSVYLIEWFSAGIVVCEVEILCKVGRNTHAHARHVRCTGHSVSHQPPRACVQLCCSCCNNHQQQSHTAMVVKKLLIVAEYNDSFTSSAANTYSIAIHTLA